MVKAKKEGQSESLSGPEKAAIFLLTLGEDFTSQVFTRLESDDIKMVGRFMAKIDKVDKHDVKSLLDEFTTDSGDHDIFLSGDDMLEQALKKAQIEYEKYRQKQLGQPTEVEKHFVEAEKEIKQIASKIEKKDDRKK